MWEWRCGEEKDKNRTNRDVGERARVDMCFFFQAEDGIRDGVASRGLGDVYRGQM